MLSEGYPGKPENCLTSNGHILMHSAKENLSSVDDYLIQLITILGDF